MNRCCKNTKHKGSGIWAKYEKTTKKSVIIEGAILILVKILIGIFLLIAVGILVINIDYIPLNVDSQIHGEYIIELKAIGRPDWTFGSKNGTIVLRENGQAVSSIDYELRNDGKYMDSGYWKVFWENDKAVVTIVGEEQRMKYI